MIKNSGKPLPAGKSYVAMPTPPTFSDSHTLTQAGAGVGITVAELGGKVEQLIGSNFDRMQFQNVGTSVKLRSDNVTSTDTWRKIGANNNDYSLDFITATPNIELYNLIFEKTKNALKLPPDAVGKIIKIVDCIIQDASFAGIQINQSIVGRKYTDVTSEFLQILRTGGEGKYWGNTTSETTFFEGITKILHCYIESTGRESLQFNGHNDLRVENVTAYLGGLDTATNLGQRNCLQVQNVKTGYIKKSIFWGFESPMMIATDNFLFEDNFFGFNNPTRRIYLQSMASNGYNRGANPGGTLEFNRCTFYDPFFTEETLFIIQGSFRNYVFRDCIFPASATDLYEDQRADKITYPIQVINPTFTNTPPLPEFINPPEPDRINFQRLIGDSHFHGRHMGFRTP